MAEKFRSDLRLKIADIGIDQGEAAERIGIQRTSLNEILNGRRIPNVRTLERIAEGLGISIEITIN